MKISVVISTYNGQEFIEEQLESLRRQDRQADEVLIFDDGSTDDTVKIITEYINTNSLKNWKLAINEVNKGWRRNFMEAMWKATGDIVFTCDQDDIWRRDKLRIMEKIMQTNPKISLLTSNYCEFFDNGKEVIGPNKNDKQIKKVALKNNYLLVGQPGCTHCIRRNLIELSKTYWKPEYAHDALLWRLAIFSDSLYTYTDTLINWRNHKNSAFAKESRNLKTIAEKEKWISIAKSFDSTLHTYVMTDVKENIDKQVSVLKRNDAWLKVRSDFYETKRISKGLYLSTFWDCFPRYRQYLGDWYLLFIKRK